LGRFARRSCPASGRRGRSIACANTCEPSRSSRSASRKYEEAARCSNRCRAADVAGSSVDFLICAVALRQKLTILTTDADFDRYATVLPITLVKR
jgi:predicted nucleic acid-binding protein